MSITIVSAERPAPEGADRAFARLAEPFRRELKAHCYRMLGSLHEAEDLVQETYLRAWRSFDSFDGRGSLRAWLYRIASNACLDALAARKQRQRLLPDQIGAAAAQMPEGAPATEVAWLEPYPDTDLDSIADDAPDPEARLASRQNVQLAFVAVLQQLPPRQRAVLLLCDVLGWATAEVATLLGGSIASVNSALQRARETLGKRRGVGGSRPSPTQQDLLDRYLLAWEGHDLAGLVSLLREDATFTMPPWRQWYQGRAAIGGFLHWAWASCGGLRLKPISANGQPAFAVYERSGAPARWSAHSIHVLTIDDDMIAAVTTFVPPTGPDLFAAFGLPAFLPDDSGSAPGRRPG